MLAIFPISAKEFSTIHASYVDLKQTDYYECNRNQSHYKEWTIQDAYFAPFCEGHYNVQPLHAGYNIGKGNAEVGAFKMGEVKIECHFAFYMTSGSNIHGVLKVTPKMRSLGYPLPVGFYALYKGARSCSNQLEAMLPRLAKAVPSVYETNGNQKMLWHDTQKSYFLRHMDKALAYFESMHPNCTWDDLGQNEGDVILHAHRNNLKGWSEQFKKYGLVAA